MARQLVIRFGKVVPWGYSRVISHYTGRKRLRYERARDDILHHGIHPRRDSRVTGFVKADRFNLEAKNKLSLCRLIQFRDPKYTLELMRYVKPLENVVYKYRSEYTGLKQYARGMTSYEAGQLIVDKLGHFKRPVVIGLDLKAFDAHVTPEQIKAETSFYNALCGDHRLTTLMRQQIDNRGRTMSGINYRLRGQRVSGDANTALGGCAIVVAMINASMRRLPVRAWDIVDSGDNVLVFVDDCDAQIVLDGLPSLLGRWGHEVSIDGVYYHINDIEFCQSRVMEWKEGWRMVRDWKKCLSHAFTSHRHYNNRTHGMRMLYTIALGEAIINRGLPIMGPYFRKIVELLHGKVEARPQMLDDDWKFRLLREKVKLDDLLTSGLEAARDAVDPLVRVEYEHCWGVTVDEQRAIEHSFSALTFEELDLCNVKTCQEEYFHFTNVV